MLQFGPRTWIRRRCRQRFGREQHRRAAVVAHVAKIDLDIVTGQRCPGERRPLPGPVQWLAIPETTVGDQVDPIGQQHVQRSCTAGFVQPRHQLLPIDIGELSSLLRPCTLQQPTQQVLAVRKSDRLIHRLLAQAQQVGEPWLQLPVIGQDPIAAGKAAHERMGILLRDAQRRAAQMANEDRRSKPRPIA